MKIIFLDIDGVLNYNNFKGETAGGTMFVSDKKMTLLARLVNETGAKIVLSSTWRVGWAHLDLGQQSALSEDFIELRDKFAEYGLEFYSRTTIQDRWSRERGDEIREWLDTHSDVEGYVILDDMSGKRLRPCSSHLLQTSTWKGLEEKHIPKILKILEMEV